MVSIHSVILLSKIVMDLKIYKGKIIDELDVTVTLGKRGNALATDFEHAHTFMGLSYGQIYADYQLQDLPAR